MRGINILSIVLIILGILLILMAYLFRIMHWPDVFFGMVSGSVIFTIGTIILVVRYFKQNS